MKREKFGSKPADLALLPGVKKPRPAKKPAQGRLSDPGTAFAGRNVD
jgi:hypothetical protein